MQTLKINDRRADERGNVLFLILIAVALFAALSYAVTQSSRSGAGDASSETNLVNSSVVTQYPAGIRTTIVRMVVDGQNVDTLEFNPPSDFANCTPGYKRCVFAPAASGGGGATYTKSDGSVMSDGNKGSWHFNGANEIKYIGTTSSGANATTSTADLIAFLPGISQGICSKLNAQLGISGVPDQTGVKYSSSDDMLGDGGSTDTSLPGLGAIITGDSAQLDGQPYGCFRATDQGNEYVYYHVLIER